MIIKGPGVQQRTRVIPHSLPAGLLRIATHGAGHTGRDGSGEGATSAAADAITDLATQQAAALLAQAEAEAAQMRAKARLDSEHALAKAQADSERFLAQAQVELGRAKAEAEHLLAQAQTRLDEAGEIIPTAAEARRILEESQTAAGEIRAAAEAGRENIYAEARDQGMEEGRANGFIEGVRLAREELIEQLELAHAIAAGARVDRETLIAAAEPEIVRLALDVARKLIAREVDADPDILKGLLTRAMLKAAGEEPMRLRLHPHAIQRLGSYLQDVSSRFASRGVEVVPDPTLDVAGVIVDTRTGSVDARLETQLQKVERTLLSLAGE